MNVPHVSVTVPPACGAPDPPLTVVVTCIDCWVDTLVAEGVTVTAGAAFAKVTAAEPVALL